MRLSEYLAASLLALLLALFVIEAGADGWQLNYDSRGRVNPYKITMCPGQSVDGPCDSVGDGTGTPVAHRFNGEYTVTLYGTQSTATAYSCDLYSNDTGYDADPTDKQKMSSTSLDEVNQSISYAGVFDYAWLECLGIADNMVKVTMLVSPL